MKIIIIYFMNKLILIHEENVLDGSLDFFFF